MISRKEYTITNSKIFKIKKLPRLFPIIYYVDTGGSLIIGKISQKKCTLLRFELTQGIYNKASTLKKKKKKKEREML